MRGCVGVAVSKVSSRSPKLDLVLVWTVELGLWLMQAKKLACFKIRGAVDDKGQLGWLCSTSFLETGGSGFWPAGH